jgi:RNA polymerase sigma factor (sigma-70 family)
MASGPWATVRRHLGRAFEGSGVTGLSEGQLLARFAEGRDELAFEALLDRHGSMVLGVCRGLLDDPRDADDAFQATFLILVKKARGVQDGDSLGPWLYGVARRVSLRARSDAARRRARERPEVEPIVPPRQAEDAELRELRALVREEVDRLKTHERMAVLLCDLEGLTHEQAADRLGWPVGTVKGRLFRARDTLKGRLARRGLAPEALLALPTFAAETSARLSPELLRSTTLAAKAIAAGHPLTAGIVSAQALTLMEGAIGTMISTTLKIAAAALVAAGTVAVPTVVAMQEPGAATGGGEVKARNLSGLTKAEIKDALPFDPLGKAISDPAREEEARLAEQALEKCKKLAVSEGSPQWLEKIYEWSRRVAEARIGPGTPVPARRAALLAHRDRMAELVRLVAELSKSDRYTEMDTLAAKFHLVEAERWVREVSTGNFVGLPPASGRPGSSAGWPSVALRRFTLKDMPADDKQNQAILAQLERKIPMDFGRDTSLADVKTAIQAATKDEAAGLPNGIPIYVDPVGLQNADKTMASTVNVQLEGVPLRTTLDLVLKQLSLTYWVSDGLLTITNEEEASFVPPNQAGGIRPGAGGGFR